MSNQKSIKIFYGWKISALSLLLTTTAFGVLYSFGAFLKIWADEWQSNRTFLSGVFSLSFLVYGISSFFMGKLTDRYGPRKPLAVGGLIMGIGAFATSQINQAWILYITFGLMIGIGVGTSYSPTVSTISRWFEKKKGVAIGIIVSGLGLGTLVYLPLTKLLINLLGWRNTFMVLGMMIWMIYFITAFVIRKDPRDIGLLPYGNTSLTNLGNDIKETRFLIHSTMNDACAIDAVKTSNFWLLFFLHCLWVLGMSIPMVHLVPYATDIGISSGTASFMLAFVGGISIVGRVVTGGIGGKIGLKGSLSFLCMFQALTLFLLAFSHNGWMLWMFCFLFGFSYGGLASVFPLITAEYFGLTAMGSIFGLILFGATLGGVIGPSLAGFIFDLTGNYFYGFIIGGLSMSFGLLLSMMLNPSKLSNCGS